MDTDATITDADTEPFVFDFGGPWTLDEIARAEFLTGLPMSQWFNGSTPEGSLRTVLAWTFAQRVNPEADMRRFGSLMIKVG